MTLEEIKALTDDEIRIKVAELLGWQNCRWDLPAVSHGVYVVLQGIAPGREMTHSKWYKEQPPDYPHDLDACHEMEEALEQRVGEQMLRVMPREYAQTLTAIVKRDHGSKTDAGIPMRGIYRATARQRCEAFVLTTEKETLNPHGELERELATMTAAKNKALAFIKKWHRSVEVGDVYGPSKEETDEAIAELEKLN